MADDCGGGRPAKGSAAATRLTEATAAPLARSGSVTVVAGQMWRVVGLFRVLTLAYAAVIIIRDYRAYAHPLGGLAVLAIMTGWTALTVIAYSRPGGRRAWLIAADVAVAVALVLSTLWIDTQHRISAGAPTLPTSWAAAPILACGVAGGPWAGVAGAAAVIAADLAERQAISGGFNLGVLLLIAGGVAGYLVRLGERAEAATDRAARAEAAAAERARIARGVHDSVLQVLALVSRRGLEIGGAAAELGRLAGEQEVALRQLVMADAAGAGPAGAGAAGPGGRSDRPGGMVDVRTLLEGLGALSCPAGPVMLAEPKARALAGAAGQAMDNVRRHAGPGAQAWVLLEDDGTAVMVSIRDDGRGIAPGRLAEAAAAGRLGVSHSIIGRMQEVGGTASVMVVPGGGTEVELAVPR